ncbi:MBL fold metallo-hydrolase [Nibribacter ruber]|uniref:MBL fold metallo-hydrolase n=1 Tax=Nibribacter ruber TaxID=2698458 RepID=A0A6P1NT80_9BACT|nr:MBL fold metallo-hydrolase [Nibribacter ruber]QHL86927.1 MBL fold metallo-hydrolase [Nibribacter ruber]
MSPNIQFIRNATAVLNYAGKRILIDPFFAEKGRYPGFPGSANSHLSNPLVEMPVKPESLIDVDAVLVSHLHPDHWDEVAVQVLPKDIKVMAQNEDDANVIKSQGFTNVEALGESANIEGLNLKKTHCQHGTDVAYSIPALAEALGKASGFYFNAEGEKSIYFLGDTIWIDEVEDNLKNWRPDVVVVNAGFASFEDEGLGAIIMGKEDILKISKLLPNATIIAMHMEAVNHSILSRKELREFVAENGIQDRVIIPEDGELITL